jgi:hypothetical protein
MGVFGPIVQIAVLAVFHSRHYLALGGLIALQFVCDDDSWHIPQALQELAEELLGRFFVKGSRQIDVKKYV